MCGELRKGGDVAARYGGEEFCVILSDTAAGRRRDGAPECVAEEGGAAIAERLRRRIAAHEFALAPGGAPVHITVSIGVASWPDMADCLDALVARTDAALYAAKRAGKDRVEVYRG
jgi:two-component system cell cycle response regulator